MDPKEIFEIRKQIYLGNPKYTEADLGAKIEKYRSHKAAEKAGKEFEKWKEDYIRQQRETAERERLMDNK